MTRRTRINWKIFEADTFLAESARKFSRRELDYKQWLKLIADVCNSSMSMSPSHLEALAEISRIKVAVPLKDAQYCAKLWAKHRFRKS